MKPATFARLGVAATVTFVMGYLLVTLHPKDPEKKHTYTTLSPLATDPIRNGTMFCLDGKLLLRHRQLGDVVLGPADASCKLKVPRHVTSLIVEVGTNKYPEYLNYALSTTGTFFVGVEPILEKYAILTKLLREKSITGMYAAVPAAVADGAGEVQFNVARISECSSLLPLAPFDRKWTPRKSSFLSSCLALAKKVWVPRIALDTLLSHLPSHVPIRLLSIDAQGYDVQVANTLRAQSVNVHNLVLECQDLPRVSVRWLYPGAQSCGQAIDCVTRLGFHFVHCSGNYEGMGDLLQAREHNCLFSNRKALGGSAVLPFSLGCSKAKRINKTWPCHEEVAYRAEDCSPT